MRAMLVCLLALVVVASPAAQAFACACDTAPGAETGADPCCCCCDDAGACRCCSDTGDEAPAAAQGCVCKKQPPRDAGVSTLDLAPPAAHPLAEQTPVVRLQTPAAAPVRRDPHPEVVLPLLV